MTKSQIREERRQRSNARKKRRRTLYMIGGGMLGAVFILAMTIGSFGGLANNNVGEGGNINEGGPVPIDDDIGRQHILPSQSGGGYSQRPATSGPHWFAPDVGTFRNGDKFDAPADWGTYEEPLPDEVLIHNLEHGGIGFHYDCLPEGCPEIVEQLKDLRPGNGWYIMSPYSGITDGHKIAITAWRHHIFMDEVDPARIEEFIDEYQDRAPESIRSNSWN